MQTCLPSLSADTCQEHPLQVPGMLWGRRGDRNVEMPQNFILVLETDTELEKCIDN